MKSYRLTPDAEHDIFEIWAFIAEDDATAADAIETEIYEACHHLAEKPDLGHFRRDLTNKPLRFYTIHRAYLIAYDPATDPLEVMRILHGARDVSAELG
jgi:plasmid stabilization system protein ParE